MKRSPTLLLAVIPFLIAVSASITAASTWFVGGPDGQFDEIQPAIDQASPGDVILVRPGVYEGFTLQRGLTIRASSAPFRLTYGSVATITNVPAVEVALLGGIVGTNDEVGIALQDC